MRLKNLYVVYLFPLPFILGRSRVKSGQVILLCIISKLYGIPVLKNTCNTWQTDRYWAKSSAILWDFNNSLGFLHHVHTDCFSIYCCWQLPPHLQRPVQVRLAFTHLHLPLHDVLHQHRMSSWQVSLACGRAVEYGDYTFPWCCHPQSDGLGRTW